MKGSTFFSRKSHAELKRVAARLDDLPRNQSTCLWHQSPVLTTSNNSSSSPIAKLCAALTDVHTPSCVAHQIKYVIQQATKPAQSFDLSFVLREKMENDNNYVQQ